MWDLHFVLNWLRLRLLGLLSLITLKELALKIVMLLVIIPGEREQCTKPASIRHKIEIIFILDERKLLRTIKLVQ